jgi:hypothetical protein
MSTKSASVTDEIASFNWISGRESLIRKPCGVRGPISFRQLLRCEEHLKAVMRLEALAYRFDIRIWVTQEIPVLQANSVAPQRVGRVYSP